MALLLNAAPLVVGTQNDTVNIALYQADNQTPLDITGYSSVQVYLKNPLTHVVAVAPMNGSLTVGQQSVTSASGTTQSTWVVSFKTLKGAAGTFPVAGQWEWQVLINYSDTTLNKSRKGTIAVLDSLI